MITLAGSGGSGFADGPAALATFTSIGGLSVDVQGQVFVADVGAHRIRVIADGEVRTLAGFRPLPTTTPSSGFADGLALSAKFDKPTDVALDGVGRLLVTDFGNERIRQISCGLVSTFAGTGKTGQKNGPKANATFSALYAVDVDTKGLIYVADMYNDAVRVIAGSQVSTLIGQNGNGAADGPVATASLNQPRGLAVDGSNAIYVADTENHLIRKVVNGVVTTIAGTRPVSGVGQKGCKDGLADAALLTAPRAIAVTSSGKVYFVGACNALRQLVGSEVVSLSTLNEWGDHDGNVAGARFKTLNGIAVDSLDWVYLSDRGSKKIKVFRPTQP